MASLTLDHGSLVLRSPYDADFVAAFKAAVPASGRKWDPSRKVWLVAPEHGQAVVNLVAQYLHELICLPQGGGSVGAREQRALDVRYIGMTKDRQDGGDRTAFGWCDGAWTVIFPERVLRAWFVDQAAPDEQSTLYGALGLSQDALGEEVKKAYRRLAMQWHPDHCREPNAKEQFQTIQHAYEVLRDDNLRARYDAGLRLTGGIRQPKQGAFNNGTFGVLMVDGYRSPFRCGLILADGIEKVGWFVVSKILLWEDITNRRGQTLVTSWPRGAEQFVEDWV